MATEGADATPAQARYRDEAAQFGAWAVYYLRLRLGGQNAAEEVVRNVWYAAHFGNLALGAQQIDDADGLALVGLDPLKRIAAFLRIYAARIRKNERWDVPETIARAYESAARTIDEQAAVSPQGWQPADVVAPFVLGGFRRTVRSESELIAAIKEGMALSLGEVTVLPVGANPLPAPPRVAAGPQGGTE